MRLYGTCFFLFIALTCASISAQTNSANSVLPKLIHFSGKVSNGSGKTQSVIVGLTFSLYQEEQGGAPLWLETQNIQLDANGHYTASLGASKPEGLPIELFASGEARWLGVQAQGQPEQPRVLLLAVPYALEAVDAETIGGLPPSAFVRANGEGGTAASESSSSQPSLDVTPKNGAPAALKTVKTPGGSVGFVPLWTSANTIGTSTLFQSGLNVSIGTGTAPLHQLDVGMTGPSAPATFSMFQTAVGVSPEAGDLNAIAYLRASPNNIFGLNAVNFGTSQALPISIGWSGQNIFLAQAGGRVGIGTVSPGSALDVVGTLKLEGLGNGITFPNGSIQTTASAQGPPGPQGPQGPPGPPGPPVGTVAACTSDEVPAPSCGCKHVIQQTSVSNGAFCQVTSNTGSCTAVSTGGVQGLSFGICCVCSPD